MISNPPLGEAGDGVPVLSVGKDTMVRHTFTITIT